MFFKAMKRSLSLLLAIIMLGAIFFNPNTVYAAESKGIGYVTLANSKGVCAIRKNPSTNSKALYYLTHGTGVSILSETTDSRGTRWYEVYYTKKYQSGFIEASKITFKGDSGNRNNTTTPSVSASTGIVTASTLNIRYSASVASKIITQVRKNTVLTITGKVGNWYSVITPNGTKGYGHSNYIQIKSSVTGNTSTENVTSSEKFATPKDGIVRIGTKLMGRSKPSETNYEVIEYLYNGNLVQVLERTTDNKFVKLVTPSGNIVWSDARYVQVGQWVKVSEKKTYNQYTRANSKYNAALACSRLTGTVIFPGNTFSWLAIMGACSKDKGYKESTVLYGGKASVGYGGGVCQVSTTINMAVKAAGITTVAQKHSLPSAYASREDEATVSYGSGIDFKFKNTYYEPIKLVLLYNDGICTCQVYKFIVD